MARFIIYETGRNPIEVDRDGADLALSLLNRTPCFGKGSVEIRELVLNTENNEYEEVVRFRRDGDE